MKRKLFLKTFLMPVLAAVILLSSCASAAAAEFDDAALIGSPYREAVEKMTERGVLNGFPDGTFQPGGTLTREQGAKITAYMVLGGGVQSLTAQRAPFDDVERSRWSAPYVAWCVARDILHGYGDGRFGPDDTLTGDQFAKMLLCAMGLARQDHYVGYGAGWADAVRTDGEARGLYAGDVGLMTEEPITREQAALMAYNAYRAAEAEKPAPSSDPSAPAVPSDPVTPTTPVTPAVPGSWDLDMSDPADPVVPAVTGNGDTETPEIPSSSSSDPGPGTTVPDPSDGQGNDPGGTPSGGSSSGGDILLPELP